MPTKDEIKKDISTYIAADIADYIKSGILSYEEFRSLTEGPHPANARKRKEVNTLLAACEPEEWKKACAADTEEAYARFISIFPFSRNVPRATDSINIIKALNRTDGGRSLWEKLDKTDAAALQNFIDDNPDSPYIAPARGALDVLRRKEREQQLAAISRLENPPAYTTQNLIDEIRNDDSSTLKIIRDRLSSHDITKETILSILENDNNFLPARDVKYLLNNNIIAPHDLTGIGIDERFVNFLLKNQSEDSAAVAPTKILERIEKVSTEVYFWGIPSSGKSCALGAILSTANNGRAARSMIKDNTCQGYGYMTQLASLFKTNGKVNILPTATKVDYTTAMSFDLVDKDDYMHPLTVIDLAGELIRCMYKHDAGIELREDEQKALDTLRNILIDNRSGNRKIHFFVVEYGAEERLYEGLSQEQYLDGALNYIRSTQIFRRDTDAVYMMVTKVDKIGKKGEELAEALREYIEKNYGGFYNGLEVICSTNHINRGKVDRMPFFVGQVCFQNYCLFDETAATNIVKELLFRAKGIKKNLYTRVRNLFKL